MSNCLSVKSAVGPDSHCVNLLDEILCHGPDSLSLVAGGRQITFNAALLCSLSPLLTTLVKQSTQDNCCSVHDHIFVLFPQLRNWKTVKHFKTILSNGMVGNISRVEMEDLRNLLQMLGFNISCEEHPAMEQQAEVEGEEEQHAEVEGEEEQDEQHAEVEGEEEQEEQLAEVEGQEEQHAQVEGEEAQHAKVEGEEEEFFAEIKYEAGDEEELLGKRELFTRIHLDRNEYEEMKNLIASGSSALIDKDIKDVGTIDQEIMQDEDLEIKQEADGTLPTNLHTSDTDGNYNTEIVESVPLTKAHQDFECKQLSNSYSPCRNIIFFERLKGKLPNRETKHSVFENTENACPEGKTGKINAKVVGKGVKYQCSKCDFKSRRKWNVKSHCEAIHEGVKYPCSKCDYKATYLSHLKVHVKSVHEGVMFSCNECDYKGTQLKRHIQSVHNEIRHSCSKCDFKSTHKRNLVRHNKTVHEEVK